MRVPRWKERERKREKERKRKREGRTECRPNSSAVTRFYDTDIKFGFQCETRAGLAEDDRLSLIISAVPSLLFRKNSMDLIIRKTPSPPPFDYD